MSGHEPRRVLEEETLPSRLWQLWVETQSSGKVVGTELSCGGRRCADRAPFFVKGGSLVVELVVT